LKLLFLSAVCTALRPLSFFFVDRKFSLFLFVSLPRLFYSHPFYSHNDEHEGRASQPISGSRNSPNQGIKGVPRIAG